MYNCKNTVQIFNLKTFVLLAEVDKNHQIDSGETIDELLPKKQDIENSAVKEVQCKEKLFEIDRKKKKFIFWLLKVVVFTRSTQSIQSNLFS